MDFVILAIAAAGVAAIVYFRFIKKGPASVADITKPLSDIVNKLEGHAAEQHEAAQDHATDAAASHAKATHARGQRDHARAVADKVKSLTSTVTPAPIASGQVA